MPRSSRRSTCNAWRASSRSAEPAPRYEWRRLELAARGTLPHGCVPIPLREGGLMDYKLKPLDQQVMVITGASSGIGLATAVAAAGQGATVVLVARSENVL